MQLETVIAGDPVSPPDVPVVFAALLGMSAETSARKVGPAALPDAGPANRVLAVWVERVKESAGVVVAVATEVVKMGDSVPALKLVTVPPTPPPNAVHVFGAEQ